MKHSQEVSRSDLQTVKIRLGHFLGMFHVWKVRIKLFKFLQWKSMGVHDFSMVTDRIHWGINHCFGNKSKSIPHTAFAICLSRQSFPNRVPECCVSRRWFSWAAFLQPQRIYPITKLNLGFQIRQANQGVLKQDGWYQPSKWWHGFVEFIGKR